MEQLSLVDWSYHYAKNKDTVTRSITNIDKKIDQLLITHKTKTQLYYILESFSNTNNKNNITEILKQVKAAKDDPKQFFVIVVYNTKENLHYLIKNWQSLIDYPNLSAIFANPQSNTEKRWMIFPFTHAKITEKSSLELGLKSLAEGVEEYNK